MICQNKFPVIPSNKKIAIVGEMPGTDEERTGQPFVGYSGRFLAALLSRAGVSLNSCFLGSVTGHRPPENDISKFAWTGPEIQTGLSTLTTDLEKYQPNIVVLLGTLGLKAAKDFGSPHPLVPKAFKFKTSQWRGSLFIADSGPFEGRKCIASYNPAYCLRDYEAAPLLQFDLKKAVREADKPTLQLPQRQIIIPTDVAHMLTLLEDVRKQKLPVAIDIEGYIDDMSCISFAPSASVAFIVPFSRKNRTRYWSQADEVKIWRALAETLEDPDVPKILQNSLYDRFVLHYSYGIRVRNVVDDTMLRHWELYSELEKSLAVQASIYTDEPYYKGTRKSDDDNTFYEYCCRDSAVTYEINAKLERTQMNQCAIDQYRLNVALLHPLMYMEMRGMRYDVSGAKVRRDVLRMKLFEAQAKLNRRVGAGFTFKSFKEIQDTAEASMLTKKRDRPLSDQIGNWFSYQSLISRPNPDLATIGELEDLCGVSLNVNSAKQLVPYFYETLKLPIQYSNDKEHPKPTTDYEALLKLAKECQKKDGDPRLPVIHSCIEIRSLGTRQQMLSISADRDGRIRCGYNIVGSNTGRISCYESPTGSGYNLQTIPNYTNLTDAPGGILGDRDLFLADEGNWFFQCDLKGADGWTVAAYAAMLGDDTMLQDYYAGLKPANILALMLRGKSIPNDRNELRVLSKQVGKDDWDYFACKRVQHGCSYLEGALTVSRNILKDSEGKLAMSVPECEQLKGLFFTRYPGIKRWHAWVAQRLSERPVLVAASGQVRQFFGRPDEILTKAVAFEPQANTTYATNLAMFKLWTDPENRIVTQRDVSNNRNMPMCLGKETVANENRLATGIHGIVGPSGRQEGRNSVCSLRVEPLHQVHDALCGQFKKEDTAWSVGKIKQWFNNPLVIAGHNITIPFDGAYGKSWGETTEGKI